MSRFHVIPILPDQSDATIISTFNQTHGVYNILKPKSEGSCRDGKYLEAQNSDWYVPEVEETTNLDSSIPSSQPIVDPG